MIFIPEANLTRVIKSRKLRWAGHVARMQQKRKAFRILVGKKTDEKRPLAPHMRRCQNNIKKYIEEMEWKSVNWIYMRKYRAKWRSLLNTVICPLVL
jgi:hypothetical protein